MNQNDLFQVLKHGMAFREYNPDHSVDDEVVHRSKDGSSVIDTTKSAAELRKEYTENYVTSMNLHALYVIDSKISLIEQRYVFQLVRMAFPEGNQILCSTS